MPIDPQDVVAALRLPPETATEAEPLGERIDAPLRLALRPPGQAELVVLARRDFDDERAQNHLAVLEVLTNRAFAFAPRLLGVAGEAAIEEWQDGLTALNVQVAPEAIEGAVDAFAALHALDLREGLRWGLTPAEVITADDIPLHRLGFSAHEREPANEALAQARAVLLAGPFGFVHGRGTARDVFFTKHGPRLVDFGVAGYGHQLFDVAAFLATSGADASQRRELAGRYARARGLDTFTTVDHIELATIWWGLHEQLRLPRMLVESLGDDATTEALKLEAARVDRAIRERTGNSGEAAAIRTALWPS